MGVSLAMPQKSVMDGAVRYLVTNYNPKGNRVGWLMLSSILVEAWDLYSIAFVLVYIKQQYNPDPLLLGLAAGGTQAGALVGALIGGRLSDLVGRRVMFLATMVLFIVLALAQAFVTSVGWLVVVGGPGIGSYRAIFEGNNTLGRNSSQRIPLDFGDDTISSEEQAYIRYDSTARSFLFVPNLTKTNVVSLNDNRPTGAVELNHMDVITVGRTQLVFVPFCGAEFDWAELADAKS